jgi:hypothetical protein
MTHRVIRTINNRDYEYEETSYRVPGVKNPRKRSRYIGPVEPLRKKKTGLIGVIDKFVELARIKQPWDIGESEADRLDRLKREDAERAKVARVNHLLTNPLTLEGLKEVIALQQPTPPSFTAPELVAAPEPSVTAAPSPVEPSQPSEQSLCGVQE